MDVRVNDFGTWLEHETYLDHSVSRLDSLGAKSHLLRADAREQEVLRSDDFGRGRLACLYVLKIYHSTKRDESSGAIVFQRSHRDRAFSAG
jgi:hypothetical protein